MGNIGDMVEVSKTDSGDRELGDRGGQGMGETLLIRVLRRIRARVLASMERVKGSVCQYLAIYSRNHRHTPPPSPLTTPQESRTLTDASCPHLFLTVVLCV